MDAICHLRRFRSTGATAYSAEMPRGLASTLNKVFMRRNSLRSPRSFMFPLINAIGRFSREVSILQNTAVSRRWITSPGRSTTPSPEVAVWGIGPHADHLDHPFKKMVSNLYLELPLAHKGSHVVTSVNHYFKLTSGDKRKNIQMTQVQARSGKSVLDSMNRKREQIRTS